MVINVNAVGNVSPSVMEGGTAGDNKATNLSFALDPSLVSDEKFYQIQALTAQGVFDVTEYLTPEENTLSYDIPFGWSVGGGVSAVRILVTTPNGDNPILWYSDPVSVTFKPNPQGKFCLQNPFALAQLVSQTKENAEKAQDAADAAEVSLLTAKDYVDQILASENNAEQYAQSAGVSSSNAAASADSAASAASSASGYASSANASASNAAESAASADLSAQNAQDYFELLKVGTYKTPQMYGAVADGVTNDSAAFKAMIDGNPDGTVFFVPAGTYAVNLTSNEPNDYWYSPLDVYKRKDLTFVFAKGAKLVAMIDNINYTAYCCLFNITRSDRIKVKGGEFVGWREAWDIDHENGGNKRQAGIEINCSTNIWIDGVDSHDNIAGGLGIAGKNPSVEGDDATYCENILVQNSRFHDDYYHGTFVEGGKNVVFENVSAWGATVTNYACSIDIEGLQDTFGNIHYNENIVCRGCFFGKSRGQSVSLHKTKGATLVNCRIEGLGKEDNVIGDSGYIVYNGLSINSGEDYLVDTCDIKGSIMQDGKPTLKNAILQNCVIDGPFGLYNQNDASCYCEWTFQNNTIFLDPVAWESSGVVMYLSKGTNTVRFVNNVFNVLSSPTGGGKRCFWVTGDVVFTNNVFNVGSVDNLVQISNFWQVAGDTGRFVLEGNEFNTFCTTSDPGYLIYGVKTVPMYIVNNIFHEKGPTFAPAAFTSAGTIICTGNIFLLNARTYAVYDANAPANLYAHNTFVGNAAVSLVAGSAVSETTNTIKQMLL